MVAAPADMLVTAPAAMQKTESSPEQHTQIGSSLSQASNPCGVGVIGGVDLSEIDVGELDASDFSVHSSTDVVNPEIAAVFPEPLPAEDPSQDFFAAAKVEQAKSDGEAASDRRASSMALKSTTLSEATSVRQSKSARKKKGARSKAAPADTAAKTVTTDKSSSSSSVAKGSDAAALKRAELQEKLRQKKMMQKEFGAKANQLRNLGVSLDEIGDAVRDEASGKRVSSSKQDKLTEKAQTMLSGITRGLDSKQRSAMKQKKEQVASLVGDMFDRVLSGPGKKANHGPSKKGKKKNQGTAAASAAAPVPGGGGGGDQSEEVPELTAILDPQMEDFVRGIHEKRDKSKRRPKSPPSKPAELPVRPRVHETTTTTTTTTTSGNGAPAPPAAFTKNQLKNKRKRQKLKDKLKQLKPSGGASAGSTPATNTPLSTIPELVPIAVSSSS